MVNINPNILVVDDEASIREVISVYLRKQGYRVETAGDIEGAMEQVNSGEIKMMLCDVVIPEVDGYEILRAVKKHNKDIAVIMMTGHADTHTIKMSLSQGADDYISKPINFGELAQVIEKVAWQYKSRWNTHESLPTG